jgi:hypothetical protein
MSTEETHYMLFLYGDYENGEKYINNLLGELSPIISNEYLKFIYGDYGVVVHFKTDVDFADLNEFIRMNLAGMVDQYFLMEKTDKMSAYGPDEVIGYVLDLESDLKKPENPMITDLKEREEELDRVIQYFMSSMNEDDMDILNDTDEDDEDNEIELIKSRNKKEKSISLDQILDKITDKGMKALSKKEKQQLEKYANGK